MQDSQATQATQATQPASGEEEPALRRGWGRLQGFGSPVRQLLLLEPNVDYVLGRHSSCHLRFESAQVSNRHCSIVRLDKEQRHPPRERPREGPEGAAEGKHGGFERHPSADKALVLLKDTSSNGTFLNGKLIGKGNSAALNHKDIISLATKNAQSSSPDLFFIYEDYSETHEGEEDEELKEVSRKYHLTEVVLGTGNFAVVKLAFHSSSGEKFAVKVINKLKFIQRPKFHQNLVTEITILKKLNHPGIVRIRDVIDTSKNVYIFLELVDGGELFHLIAQKGYLQERMAKIFFYQILLSVDYLHDNNVIHRDLKPENLLLEKKGEYPLVKITDFGLAKIVGEESFMKTLCGTPNYIAPEVISQSSYNKAVDCWSLGVILYAMLAGSLPFSDDDKKALFSQIRAGQLTFPDEEWGRVTEEAKSLIRGLINIDPQKRLSVKQALAHPWLLSPDIRAIVDNLFSLPSSSASSSSSTSAAAPGKLPSEAPTPLEHDHTLQNIAMVVGEQTGSEESERDDKDRDKDQGKGDEREKGAGAEAEAEPRGIKRKAPAAPLSPPAPSSPSKVPRNSARSSPRKQDPSPRKSPLASPSKKP